LHQLDLCNCAFIFALHRMGGESVRVLNLSGTSFQPIELEMLSDDMPNICELSLQDCTCGEDDSRSVIFCKAERFSYASNDVNLFFDVLRGATRLKHLNIRHKTFDGGVSVRALLDGLPSTLKSLSILVAVANSNGALTKETIESWIKYLDKLETYEMELISV
jgi:hypothetical protein